MNRSPLPNFAVLDQAAAAVPPSPRPLRHALRACGVGAGPYGRAGRTARRSTAVAVGALQRHRQARAAAARQGAGPPADSLWSPYGWPTAIERQPRSPHHTGALITCLWRGTQARGWRGQGAPVKVVRGLRWKPGHPLCRRPRTSRADQALPVKVVRPVGRSTFTGRAWPAPRWVGRRQRG